MGPRRAVAKRAVSSSVLERRTKMRHEEPTLQSMADRVVTTGRKLDFDFLAQEGFQIGEWLKAQSWEKFCSLDIPIYPRLVKSFFEHLKIRPRQLESTVNGTKIILDEAKISRILEMPMEGCSILRLEDRLVGLRCILEKDDVSGIALVQANQLSVELRFLHHIISRIIFPKTGRFDWVTERDISLMYFLINGIQVNLPYMMILQISEAMKKNKACLPFGMVFTLIFRDCGVNLNGEVSKKLMHTDYYNKKSLHRMGFMKVNDRWIKKTSGFEHMEEEPQEIHAEAPSTAETGEPSTPVHDIPAPEIPPFTDTPQPDPQATSTVQETFLLDLRKEIFEKLDKMAEDSQAEIEHLRGEMIKSQLELKNEIKGLTKRLGSVEQTGELHREIEGQLVKEASRLNKKVEDALSVQWQTTGLLHQGMKDLQNQVTRILEKVSSGCATQAKSSPSTTDHHQQGGTAHCSGEGPSSEMVVASEVPIHNRTSPTPQPNPNHPSPSKESIPQPKPKPKSQVRKSTKPPVHHKPYSTRPSHYRFPKPTKSGVEVISSSSESE